MSNKEYLGDAVYIEIIDATGELKLTTSNGIVDTNTIIIETLVLVKFLKYTTCVVCHRVAPLVDKECPVCRH